MPQRVLFWLFHSPAPCASVSGTCIPAWGLFQRESSTVSKSSESSFERAPVSKERLLTRFSVPEELFGPLSLKSLEQDEYIRKTTGYLPEAAVAFIDEIFKANSAILNTLLSVVNERVFDNGPVRVAVPLRCLVAASNEAPESEELEALYDRLLFRLLVQPVSDGRVAELVAATSLQPPGPKKAQRDFAVGLGDAQRAQELAGTVTVPKSIVDVLVDCRRFFKGLQPPALVSDRRLGQAVRMMQAAAWTCGRSEVELCDCTLLGHVLWSNPDHCEQFQDFLRSRLARTRRRQLSAILGGLLERVEMLGLRGSRASRETFFDADQLWLRSGKIAQGQVPRLRLTFSVSWRTA